MKKPLMSLGVTAVLFLACNVQWSDLTMPEQVKVETTPGLYLPLTSNLFSGEFEQYSPEKLINEKLSPGKVKEMIGDNMSGITVSTYKDPGDLNAPLTYLLRYSLAEMPFDLSQYMMNLELEAPSISLNVGSGMPLAPGAQLPKPIAFPPVEADIRDMANLISSLTYTGFGIRIAGDFEDALTVGITDGNTAANGGFEMTSTGTYNAKDNYTDFVSSSGTWKPSKDHATLTIAMTLTKYPSTVSDGKLTIAPEFVLDWDTAIVNPGDSGILEGELPLDFHSLGETLNGIRFPDDSIKAYLYTRGLPDSDAKITLTSIGASSSNILVNEKKLTEAFAPEFPADDAPYMELIPPSSLSDTLDNPGGAIDLTGTLNASLSGKVTLNYTLEMGSLTLEKSKLKETETISAILLIKLPLALQYSGSSFNSKGTYYTNGSESPVNKNDYLKFEMDELDLSDIFGDDDLLEPIKEGINSGGVSGQLALNKLSLVLANCDASLLPGVCIAIKQNKETETGVLIDFSRSDPKGDIPIELNIKADEPFAPSIDILLKKKSPNDNFVELSLKEGGRFRFGLIVEIESALDVTVTL
ncbi:MAG: hypothetical protein LBL45_08095 [Treponema sp.]|jgi:hypothetical protein|nr:hypothetical protein [Treponema sp.]